MMPRKELERAATPTTVTPMVRAVANSYIDDHPVVRLLFCSQAVFGAMYHDRLR